MGYLCTYMCTQTYSVIFCAYQATRIFDLPSRSYILPLLLIHFFLFFTWDFVHKVNSVVQHMDYFCTNRGILVLFFMISHFEIFLNIIITMPLKCTEIIRVGRVVWKVLLRLMGLVQIVSTVFKTLFLCFFLVKRTWINDIIYKN